MKYSLIFLSFFFLSQLVTAQAIEEEQVDAWSESPARQRLEQIEQYKPTVRRSRIIAIKELEEDLSAAREAAANAQRLMNYQLSRDGRQSKEAWDSTQIEFAQTQLDTLNAFIEQAQEFLVYAKAENEKVMKYLAREQKRVARDTLAEGEGDEDEDEEDDEFSDPDRSFRVKTRLNPEDEEDLDGEEDIDED